MITFLKLGGSLITDKAAAETARHDVIHRIAAEIAAVRAARPGRMLLVGHGSGSFGHMAARRSGTRQGVTTTEGWRGFAAVSVSAARLNQIVLDALHDAGLPVFRIQPSAVAVSRDGPIVHMEITALRRALDEGLLPLVYGDVAFDEVRGGTIISTEDVFTYLAGVLHPGRILLAGLDPGVLDQEGNVIPLITPATLGDYRDALGGSAHTDVTGGMASKVTAMLALCQANPGLSVHIFSGREPGSIERALLDDRHSPGTRLADDDPPPGGDA